MREHANKAAVHYKVWAHPIQTVDEILHDINGAQCFVRLDLRMTFHIILEENLRYITKLVTHRGLFQSTRLMFVITSTPKLCQHV